MRRVPPEALERAERVELVAALVAGMAHDLHNLLSAIVVNAEYALERAGEAAEARAALEDVRQGAACAAGLTRQLLALGRTDAADAPLTDLNTVVRGLEPLLRRAMGPHIRTVVELSPDVGSLGLVQTQVAQILLNLAVNARDAMPRGGEVTITTRSVDGDGAGAARWALLRVRDTGHGMDAATRARLFEPFFTTKGPGRGTGLGLTAVASIVKRAGGRILVQSTPGGGTAFEIVLPCRRS